MPHNDPKTVTPARLSLNTIQAAQAAVERGEATVAEFDRLVTLDWNGATSSLAPPRAEYDRMDR